MTTQSEFFVAIADYYGQKDDKQFIPIFKGEIVRFLKQENNWLTVEKDSKIG